MEGHTIEECRDLKDKFQQLIDAKVNAWSTLQQRKFKCEHTKVYLNKSPNKT